MLPNQSLENKNDLVNDIFSDDYIPKIKERTKYVYKDRGFKVKLFFLSSKREKLIIDTRNYAPNYSSVQK